MDVRIVKENRKYLEEEIPLHEEWRGEGGHNFYSELCLVIGNNGAANVPLTPKVRVGSNYSHSELIEQEGETYLESLQKYFESDINRDYKVRNLPVIILRRSYSDWVGQDMTDELEIVVVEGG